MGDVYRAVRDDDHFKKVVAVKLVRTDVASELVDGRLAGRAADPGAASSIPASRACSTAAPRRTDGRSW